MILTKKNKNNKKTSKKYKNNKQSKKSKKFKNNKQSKKIKKIKKTFKKGCGHGPYINFNNITKTTLNIQQQIKNKNLSRLLSELNIFLQENRGKIKGKEFNKKFSCYLFFKLFDKKNSTFLETSIRNRAWSNDLINLLMDIYRFNNIPEKEKDKKKITRIEKQGKLYMDLLYYMHDKPSHRFLEDQHKEPDEKQDEKPDEKPDERYYEEMTLNEICENINRDTLTLYNSVKDLIAISENMKFIKIRSGNSVDEDVYFMVEDIDFPLTDSGYDEFFNIFTQKELIDRLKQLDKIKTEGRNTLFSQLDSSKPYSKQLKEQEPELLI